MKKGKTSKINLFEKAKCHYGTVDSKNFKSVYIVLQTWVSPKKELEKWERTTSNLHRKIKHTICEVLDSLYFEKNFIVDLDLRSSGIQMDKRSFMNLEITIFLKNDVDFKSPILKEKLKSTISSVYKYDLLDSEHFTLHKTKTEKLVDIQE